MAPESGEITNPFSRSRPPSTRMELLPCGIGHFHDTPRHCQILLPGPGEQMNDQQNDTTVRQDGLSACVFGGKAEDLLPGFPEGCADSVVTDPPYGLADLKPALVTGAIREWVTGNRWFVPDGRGFMSRDWDRFVPPPGIWDECYRILKPGGYLLACAAPRTADLMGLSIRLAGFEIQDSLHWLYGTGFPKGKSRLKPAHEPILMCRKPDKANPPLPGIDGCRVAHLNGENPSAARRAGKAPGREIGSWANDRRSAETFAAEHPGEESGRWPPNLLLTHSADCNGQCAPDCPVAGLDTQQNGASRFFPHFTWSAEYDLPFLYQAKAPAAERPVLPDGTKHPTCKPLALMRWLARLVTPPGGLVLDPFCGTGTTIQAALEEGFRATGIDDWPAAIEMARIRLARYGNAVVSGSGAVACS